VRTVGLDIGGSSVKAVALNGGRVESRAASAGYHGPDAGEIRSAIDEAVRALGVGGLDRLGLCLPGIVDDGVVRRAVNLPGLEGCAVSSALPAGLAAGLPEPVVVTDAHAAGYGYWCAEGMSTGARRVASIVLGTGVGFAVLDDGVLLEVDRGASGHLGQIDVSLNAHAPIGPDGGRGGLEAYLGAAALARLGDGDVEPHTALLHDGPPLFALARAIRIVLALFCPDVVALLGGVGGRLEPALPRLRELVGQELSSVVRPGWQLRVGEDPWSAALGAAALCEHRGEWSRV